VPVCKEPGLQILPARVRIVNSVPAKSVTNPSLKMAFVAAAQTDKIKKQ
jgi:hypothetical protein